MNMKINENSPAQFQVHSSNDWCYYLLELLSTNSSTRRTKCALLPELVEDADGVSWENGDEHSC